MGTEVAGGGIPPKMEKIRAEPTKMSQLYNKWEKEERSHLPTWYVPVTEELLQEITQRIIEACQPEKIILFGSYAYGKSTSQSDVDLLVIMDTDQSTFERHKQVSLLFPYRLFALDILVRTPDEVAHRLEIGDNFFREILTRGRVLYERGTGRRMDTQSRRGLRKRASPGASAQKASP